MRKIFFLLLGLMVIVSCESDITDETLESVSAKTKVCDGYGIFSNAQYDCGWKRGYTDWVYHYNITVQNYDLPECYKANVVTLNGTTRIVVGRQYIGANLARITKNNNYDYYNYVIANQFNSDFSAGQSAGYQVGWGQEPYAENNGDTCF